VQYRSLMPRLVLFPSPLLARRGFLDPLAAALRGGGYATSVLNVVGGSNAEMIAAAAPQAHRAAGDEPIVLVPYSGAGPLVPSVLAGFPAAQAAAVFLDATLPHPDRRRLEELSEALPAAAFDEFDRGLRAGGSWPDWTDEQLTPLIPDDETRRAVLAMVTPRPLGFFEEPLPSDGLPAGIRCAYLRLSAAYDQSLAAAESRGWPSRSLDLTHFAPYTHPAEVARELVALSGLAASET
jgi:hypothetical protein